MLKVFSHPYIAILGLVVLAGLATPASASGAQQQIVVDTNANSGTELVIHSSAPLDGVPVGADFFISVTAHTDIGGYDVNLVNLASVGDCTAVTQDSSGGVSYYSWWWRYTLDGVDTCTFKFTFETVNTLGGQVAEASLTWTVVPDRSTERTWDFWLQLVLWLGILTAALAVGYVFVGVVATMSVFVVFIADWPIALTAGVLLLIIGLWLEFMATRRRMPQHGDRPGG